MIRSFPDSALTQLEFDKIKQLLQDHCQTAYAKAKASQLRVHTKKEFIDLELQQSHEYQVLLQSGLYFPNDTVLNLSPELKLLSIPGAVLTPQQVHQVRLLAETSRNIFRWFTAENRAGFPGLAAVIGGLQYEKEILLAIERVFDDEGAMRDDASPDLADIRMRLYRKRQEVRKVFDRVVQRWGKSGYVADVEEAFLNGRRVIAVHAEYKRQVKGILLGESDSRKTTFMEPEETIELNNEVFELEQEESREIYRILKALTAHLSPYAPLLMAYHQMLGEYDFIRAKGKLAQDIGGQMPLIHDRSEVRIIEARHPLLLLYNKANNKVTVPTSVSLDETNRILVISGPNAGGKTVTLKTVGLLQLMVQSGLLVPVHPSSTMGIYKQLMIHIGDTQSLEFDLSTYSSHLKNMKYFIENASGRTLFFIDELGSGSDPNLGGAFAEVILGELVKKHAQGIVTTHYLNLKIMAGKTTGIFNGAMAFDEKNLQPLFKLLIGKPGSSYTFSIAERIGLDPALIEKARKLVDEGHFRLDKLLNRTEQELQLTEKKERELNALLRENEQIKKEMLRTMDREKHDRQVELLQLQNRISEERISYLKEMERKLKQLIIDWRKAGEEGDKKKLVLQMQQLLFRKQQQQKTEKARQQIVERFRETGEEVAVGKKVLLVKSHQSGEVKAIRGKNAVIQVGLIPITVDIKDLKVIVDKDNSLPGKLAKKEL